MKHLHEKKEFNFNLTDEERKELLDVFPTPPNSGWVVLTAKEVTSLCPLTGQPDYHDVTITYCPYEWCIESKSLKLYLGSFRMYGAFTETLAGKIAEDLYSILNCKVDVTVQSVSRGGISITATARRM